MANDDGKLARTTRSEAERAQGDGDRPAAGQPSESIASDVAEVELALADLVSDARGEIVFYNDSGFRSLAVRTDRAVVDEGRAGAHVTAAGEDVSGFKFVTFDNGLTLYFEAGLDLILLSAGS
jgi:hypothetical protein